jgi:hypothetical protein
MTNRPYLECISQWLGYGLDGWDSIHDRARYFTVLHSVGTASGAHLSKYFPGLFHPGVKWQGLKAGS